MKKWIIAAVWMLLAAPVAWAQDGPVKKAIQQFEDGDHAAAKGHAAVLLSSEDFCLLSKHAETLRFLDEGLQDLFAEVRYVLVLRDLRTLLPSW